MFTDYKACTPRRAATQPAAKHPQPSGPLWKGRTVPSPKDPRVDRVALEAAKAGSRPHSGQAGTEGTGARPLFCTGVGGDSRPRRAPARPRQRPPPRAPTSPPRRPPHIRGSGGAERSRGGAVTAPFLIPPLRAAAAAAAGDGDAALSGARAAAVVRGRAGGGAAAGGSSGSGGARGMRGGRRRGAAAAGSEAPREAAAAPPRGSV